MKNPPLELKLISGISQILRGESTDRIYRMAEELELIGHWISKMQEDEIKKPEMWSKIYDRLIGYYTELPGRKKLCH
jgi:hypothetical protein